MISQNELANKEQTTFVQHQKQVSLNTAVAPEPIAPDATAKNKKSNRKKSVAIPRPAVEMLRQTAEQKWDARYQHTQGVPFPYRTYKTSSGGIKLFFQLGNEDDNWEEYPDTQPAEVRVDLETLKQLNPEKLKEMWQGQLPDRPEGYVPQESEIVDIRNAVIDEALRHSGMTMNDYRNTLIDGDDSGATFKLLKQVGAWDMFHLLAVTQAYYQFDKFKDEYIQSQLEKEPRAEVKGTSVLRGKNFDYESQGYQNCYACSLAGAYNHMISNDPALQNSEMLNQEKVRSFVPRYLSREELEKVNPVAAGDDDALWKYRKDIELFAGPGKTSAGNITAIADVLFEEKKHGGLERSDIAVFEKTYGIDRVYNDTVRKNIFEAIKKQIHEVLDGKQMVCLRTHGHYVTVVGLKDNKIKYLDSLRKENPDIPVEEELDTFLKGHSQGGAYDAVELSFLKKISEADLPALKSAYKGLDIDEETGEVVRKNDMSKQNDVAHRAGIVIVKERDEIYNEGDADIARFISDSVCLSRAAFMNDAQKQAWKAKNEELSDAAETQWHTIDDKKKEDEKALSEVKAKLRKEAEEEAAKKKAAASVEAKRLLDEKTAREDYYTAKDKKAFEKVSASILKGKYKEVFKADISKEKLGELSRLFRLVKGSDKNFSMKSLDSGAKALIECQKDDVSSDNRLAACRIIEGAFKNILSIDFSDLEAGSGQEMVEKMNTYGPLFEFAQDKDNFIFSLYRQMAEGQDIKTALDSGVIPEVKGRLAVIDQYGSYYRAVLAMEQTPEKVRSKVKDIYSMTAADIEAAISAEKDPELLNYYAKALSVSVERELKNSASDPISGERRKALVSAIDTLETQRKNIEDFHNLKDDVWGAFIQRQSQKDKRLKRLVKEDEKQYTSQLGKMAIDCTKFGEYGDSDAASLYLILKKGIVDNAGVEEKQHFVNAVETIAGIILKFDRKKLEVADARTLLSNKSRYNEIEEMALFSRQARPFIDQYLSLNGTEGLNFALDAGMMKAVRERISFFDGGSNMTIRYANLMNAADAASSDFDMEEYLTLPKEEREAKKASLLEKYGKGKLGEVFDFAFPVLDSLIDKKDKPWFGKTGKWSEENEAEAVRALDALKAKSDAAIKARQDKAKQELTENASNYTHSGTLEFVKNITAFSYGNIKKEHLKLTVKNREKKMRDPKSPLYKKVGMANLLTENAKAANSVIAKRRRDLAFNERTMVSEKTLKSLSAFFGEEKEDNIALLKDYAKDRMTAMDIVTKRFLELNVMDIDFSTDEALVSAGSRLEEISKKMQAYRMLFASNPDYEQHLRDIPTAGGTTVYDKVKQQMEEIGVVTDYYRARKLVITNSYYMSHYNDEISVAANDKAGAEEHELSQLLILSVTLADKMKSVFGARARGYALSHTALHEELIGPGYQRARSDVAQMSEVVENGADATLKKFEDDYRVRAYADGRPDLSLCSTEKVNSLIKELESIKSVGLENMDMKNTTPQFRRVVEKASPEVAQILKFYMLNSTVAGMKEYSNQKYPKLIKMLRDTFKPNDNTRVKDIDAHLTFKDRETGGSYTCGVDMNRELDIFCRMADSEGMSDEEAMELFDNLSVSNWKDCDMEDEEQAARAKKIYLESMAKFYQMYYEHHKRYYNTYGLLPDQMPTPLLIIAMPDSFRNFRLRMDGAGMDDHVTKGGLTVGDKRTSMLDVLVSNNYLTREFADDFIRMADHIGGTAFNTCDNVIQLSQCVVDSQQQRHLDLMSDDIMASVNKHRKDYDGQDIPRLSPKDEIKQWKMLRGSTEIGKSEYRRMEDDNIRILKSQAERTRTIVELQRFIVGLEGVDTGGHSKKYKVMSGSISRLQNTLETIAGKPAPDGKNVTLKDIVDLRGLYRDVIEASTSYLEGKDRNHRNAKYRRRYDIVEELQNTLKKDYEVLNSKNTDKAYSLDELFTEGRQVEYSVSEEDVSAHSGAMSVRYAFDVQVDGKTKRMAFTERNSLEAASVGNPFREMSGFPIMASAAGILGRRAMDEFFNQPTVKTYLRNCRKNKDKPGDYEKFTEDFENFLNVLWTKNKAMLSLKSPRRFPIRSGNAILGEYKSLSKDKRAAIVRNIHEIGLAYNKASGKVFTHQNAGIGVGANIDKRNVAMSIMSRAMNLENRIARAQLAKVEIKSKDKKTKAQDGILMEWVQGYSFEKVKEGIESGEIICDNEKEIIQQLSDLQVIDYICGNIDRHMGNMMFEMEKINVGGVEKLRIKRIVGIDNDMSFGRLDAEDVEDFVSRLSSPELMQVMRSSTANRILEMDRDRLFLMLGTTVTEPEKASMWTRVEFLKEAIREARNKKSGLRILEEEEFEQLTVQDLANGSFMQDNIYKMFQRATSFKKNEEMQNHPHRQACDEQRVHVVFSNRVSIGGIEYGANQSAMVQNLFLDISSSKRRKILANHSKSRALFNRMKDSAKEFDSSVGTLFTNLSSNPNYKSGEPKDGHADLFDDDFAREHGMKNGIMDIFYIEDKHMSKMLPAINEIMNAFKNASKEINDIPDAALRDMVVKSVVMSYISSGKGRVTIANYQQKKGGGEELVISDINTVRYRSSGINDLIPWVENDVRGNDTNIQKCRKNREKRFAAIREDVEKRRNSQ